MFKLNSELLDSWFFFRTNLVAMSFIILPLIIPIEMGTAIYVYIFSYDIYSISVPILIWFLIYPIYTVGVIFYISSVVSGDPIDINSAWKLGVKYWFPYMGLTLLSIIAVLIVFLFCVFITVILYVLFGIVSFSGVVIGLGDSLSLMDSLLKFGSILTTLGFLVSFFVLSVFVLGTVVIIRFMAFSGFDLLFNGSTLIGALKNSWKLTKGCILRLVIGFFVISLILTVPSYLLPYLLSSAFGYSGFLYEFFYAVVNLLLSVFFVLYIIFYFRVYDREINQT